jgi:hypothetical protein
VEKLTVTVLSYDEFDKLVHENFPERADYEFVANEEVNNDSAYLYKGVGVPIKYKEDTPQELIDKWRQDDLASFQNWLDKKQYSGIGTHKIFEALCRKGVIEPGNYLIKVSW